MAVLGATIKIDVKTEPSERLKELIRSFVRQELAGELGDIVQDMKTTHEEKSTHENWSVVLNEEIRAIAREEVRSILSEPKAFVRAIAPALADEIMRLIRMGSGKR